MKLIPTKIHGIIDYVVAALLIFAPFIFNFASVGGAAVVIPIVFGIVFAVYSALTNYEEGILRAITIPYHMMIDVIMAAGLALSPFLFNFADRPLNVWLPHVLAGMALIIVVLLSQTEVSPFHRRRHHVGTPHYPHSAL